MADEANTKTPEQEAAAAEAEAQRQAAEAAEAEAAKAAKGTKPEKKAATKPAKGDGPVFALCKVTYGKGVTAPASSVFWPTSAKERQELFKLGAVREPTEGELVAAPPAPDVDPIG